MSEGYLKGMVLTGLAGLLVGGFSGYWLKAVDTPAVADHADLLAADRPAARQTAASSQLPGGLGGFKLVDVVSDGDGQNFRAWIQDAETGMSSQYEVGDMLSGHYEIRSIAADRLTTWHDGREETLLLSSDAASVVAEEDARVVADEALSLAVMNQLAEQGRKMTAQMRHAQQKPEEGDPSPDGH